jgi:predicted DNA-binding transcriptional regulator YafY
MLMLLQSRGRMTAGELADELEVSERTIYRDVDALSAAGVPVYGESGPNGGFALLDEYRTRLTGLTADETRALFMLSIPAPLEGLGVDEHLRAAMRKLAASVPESRRADEERVRSRYLLDARPLSGGRDAAPRRVPHLQVLHQAVWNDHVVEVALRTWWSEDVVYDAQAYALVAKGSTWHAVLRKARSWRAVRVSDLSRATDTGDSFERDPSFELRTFWDEWCEHLGRFEHGFRVTALVEPASLSEIRRRFGVQTRAATDTADTGSLAGTDERILVELTFNTLESARDQLLALGRGVEVVAPEALRLSIADYAEQIAGLYAR